VRLIDGWTWILAFSQSVFFLLPYIPLLPFSAPKRNHFTTEYSSINHFISDHSANKATHISISFVVIIIIISPITVFLFFFASVLAVSAFSLEFLQLPDWFGAILILFFSFIYT